MAGKRQLDCNRKPPHYDRYFVHRFTNFVSFVAIRCNSSHSLQFVSLVAIRLKWSVCR